MINILEKEKLFNEKAWKKEKFFIFSTHPDNFQSKLFKYPKYYGYCYIIFNQNNRLKAMFTLVPFNWVLRKVRDLYLKIKFGKSSEYSQMVYAKQAGFREGIETAIAISKQFGENGQEEVRARLNGCL